MLSSGWSVANSLPEKKIKNQSEYMCVFVDQFCLPVSVILSFGLFGKWGHFDQSSFHPVHLVPED